MNGFEQPRECVRAGSMGNSFAGRHHGNYRTPCAHPCVPVVGPRPRIRDLPEVTNRAALGDVSR
jgi:hypothetical protein